MGGASSQVALECQNCRGEVISLYGNEYEVFLDSLMCYGMEEQMKRFVAARIAENINDLDPDSGEKTDKWLRSKGSFLQEYIPTTILAQILITKRARTSIG